MDARGESGGRICGMAVKQIKWTLGKTKIKYLVDYEHNPVQIKDRAAKELARNLREKGQDLPYVIAAPLVQDKPVPLMDGHQKKAVELSINKVDPNKVVPVLYPDRKLSEREKKEWIVTHRKNVGEWNFDILANNFDVPDLLEWGFDERELLGAGFEMDGESRDAEPQINRAEELQKVWKVKTGDCFSVGQHKLLCGDSTSEDSVKRLMGKDKATLLFTDPPYGVAIGAKNRMLNSFQKAGMNLTDIESDQDSAEDLGAMLLSAFTLIKKFLAADCSVFVCSPQGGSLGLMMMMNAGLEIRHVLNWVKNSPTFSLGRLDYEYQHEPILFTWVKTHKRYKRGFTTSTWNVNKPLHSSDHPTIKPIELPTNAILNHTDEGDVVIDIFGGSGTTMVACNNLGRKCRMIEISELYCAVILQRMADAFPGLKIEKIK